jgi:hypothetical protein
MWSSLQSVSAVQNENGAEREEMLFERIEQVHVSSFPESLPPPL